MTLNISTFANQKPASFFKALGHPKIFPQFKALCATPIDTIFDPEGLLEDFLGMTLWPAPKTLYVQAIEKLTENAHLISNLPADNPSELFILSFDPDKYLASMGHLIPPQCKTSSLKDLRLPDDMLTVPQNYLSDLNFSTNFALFRESDGWHTRLKTANYWAKYGSEKSKLWAILFDESGHTLAQWEEALDPKVDSIVIESQEIKKRFNLPDFTGQLFIHVTQTKGHSIVKYALDTFHDSGMLSGTHDANAWPAHYFAGLPAPRPREKVLLWLQNSHPLTIPAEGMSLNVMGEDATRRPLARHIPPFGTYVVDVETYFPQLSWPEQIELNAGQYTVRPRYEVINEKGYRCIAHINVERTDLKADGAFKAVAHHFGKGYILPAPLLPTDDYVTTLLPTPMNRETQFFPVKALAYDQDGTLLATHSFGNLRRHHTAALVLNDIVSLPEQFGHVELVYDFDAGDEADGWLHGLFRYEHKHKAAQAETSFGSHIFNTPITYKNEPQSYKGPPPGLTTGLFLRLDDHRETFCQLIYPISLSRYPLSDTWFHLYSAKGEQIATSSLKIPQGGSRLWIYDEAFSPEHRAQAQGGYVVIQDATCRLFGYHGLGDGQGNFSLDHMFGF